MKIRSMQTCIMSSLPHCIFRCSVFRYVTLVSFVFLFKLCYLIVTLLLWWRINTYLLTYCADCQMFYQQNDGKPNVTISYDYVYGGRPWAKQSSSQRFTKTIFNSWRKSKSFRSPVYEFRPFKFSPPFASFYGNLFWIKRLNKKAIMISVMISLKRL